MANPREILEASEVDLRARNLLNDLLAPFDMTAIVTYDEKSRRIYVGGVQVDEARLKSLQAEAEALTQFDLWKLIQETPKALAERAMFVSGESLDDLKKGRSILYTLATQKRIVDTFKNYAPTKPSTPSKPGMV